MFERYNDEARRALFFARQEASHIGGASIDVGHLFLGISREHADALAHRHIGREHLLLGILRQEDNESRAWLTRHGIQLNAVRVAVRKSDPETNPLHGHDDAF